MNAVDQIVNKKAMNSKFNGGKCFLCKQIIYKDDPIYFCPDRLVHKGESKACHQNCGTARIADPISAMAKIAESIKKPEPQIVAQDDPALKGYFTVVFEIDGKKERRTLRIHTQRKDANFAPSKKIISLLTGSNNEADYTGFGFIEGHNLRVWGKKATMIIAIEAAKVLLEGDNYKVAGKAYVLESGHCCRCNRLLTVDTSIEAAMGPICAKKVGW